MVQYKIVNGPKFPEFRQYFVMVFRLDFEFSFDFVILYFVWLIK